MPLSARGEARARRANQSRCCSVGELDGATGGELFVRLQRRASGEGVRSESRRRAGGRASRVESSRVASWAQPPQRSNEVHQSTEPGSKQRYVSSRGASRSVSRVKIGESALQAIAEH